MSIYTDMMPAMLQVNINVIGTSGAPKQVWEDVENINVAIYDNDSFRSTQSAKYEQSTHNGCSFYKSFMPGKEYRLVVSNDVYEITSVNTSGRVATLLLRKTMMYGKK